MFGHSSVFHLNLKPCQNTFHHILIVQLSDHIHYQVQEKYYSHHCQFLRFGSRCNSYSPPRFQASYYEADQSSYACQVQIQSVKGSTSGIIHVCACLLFDLY